MSSRVVFEPSKDIPGTDKGTQCLFSIPLGSHHKGTKKLHEHGNRDQKCYFKDFIIEDDKTHVPFYGSILGIEPNADESANLFEKNNRQMQSI